MTILLCKCIAVPSEVAPMLASARALVLGLCLHSLLLVRTPPGFAKCWQKGWWLGDGIFCLLVPWEATAAGMP